MLQTILNWLSGGLLDKAIGFFERREQRRFDAMNDEQRRAHEERKEVRRNATKVRLATANHIEMRVMTFLIAFPFVEQLWAVWADTRFGWYSQGGVFERCWTQDGKEVCGVPAFPAPFDEWQGAILLSFFGLVGVVGGIRAAAGAIAYWRR